MKLTEFKVGDTIYSESEPSIHFTVMSQLIKTDFGLHIYNTSYPFLKEDWELVEQTYTTREAFKMLADGKRMISCNNDCYEFSLSGDLILTYKDEDYEPAILHANELLSKWTEFKEKN